MTPLYQLHKRISFLFLVPLFMSCSNLEEQSASDSITRDVFKIETSYHSGSVKIENDQLAKSIETSMKAEDEEKLSTMIDRQINQKLNELKDRYKTARTIFDGYDVGVIPNVDACPAWSERIMIFMDCEDFASRTYWLESVETPFDGYRGSWKVDDNRNLRMVFCRVDGREFLNPEGGLYTPAAVLKLGANFVARGTIQRHFDNEDSDNINKSSGDIAPNISNRNTTLLLEDLTGLGSGYCCGGRFPDFGFGYGLIGSGGHYGWLEIDDENSDNANSLKYDGRKVSSVENYLYGGSNTRMFITRVTQ